MATEIGAFGPAEPYPLEVEGKEIIITDPLREDPFARVAYSSNPRPPKSMPSGSGFNEMDDQARVGAHTPHPIHEAKDSLLARPDIAEALEQIYLDTVSSPDDSNETGHTDKDGMHPVDVSLALDGLQWLKKHPYQDARGKRNTGDTEQAEKEAVQEAYKNERDAQLMAVAEAVKQSSPSLDFDGFFRLADALHSSKDPDGLIISKQRRGFNLKVDDQVMDYIDNPDRLVNGMGAIKQASEFLESDEQRANYPIAAAFVDRIERVLTDMLQYGSYEDLTEDIVDKWFSAIGSADEPEIAAETLYATGIMQRTISTTVRKNPAQFIDRLHMFSMRGLDPSDEVTHTAALAIIRNRLEADAMAACSLIQASFFAEDPEMAAVQQQAMDLVLTLMESDVPVPSYYSHDRYNRGLKRLEKKKLEAALVPRLPDGRVDMEAWQARTPQQAEIAKTKFTRMATSRKGRAITLYGRLKAHDSATRGLLKRWASHAN